LRGQLVVELLQLFQRGPDRGHPDDHGHDPGRGWGCLGRVSVSISNYAFQPATITVALGSKVSFTNHDQTAHTATSIKTAFDTGTVQPGASATVTLKKPGTYGYYCQFHAFMHGTIVVK